MPPIVSNRHYNSPELGAAFENLSSLFSPVGGADIAGYAAAGAKKAEAERLAQLFDYAKDPRTFDAEQFDRMGVAAGVYAPNQSYYSVDEGNATQRYGYDVAADASIANNKNTVLGSTISSLYDNLAPGEIRPALPANVAGLVGLPAIEAAQGLPKPLSETEWAAGQNERLLGSGKLTDQMILDTIVGAQTPVKAVGPGGKEIFMSPGAAVQAGAQPAPGGPSTVVNMGPNGIDYGSPGDGLVWQRTPDGKIALDDRGAPIAIPYQGGKVWADKQARDAAAGKREDAIDTKANIVVQDLDRALSSITANPALTTGVGQQATGWVGGSPAKDLQELLNSVRANVGFDALQAMRDQSPTGAALGNVTERETALLQSTLGSIDPLQGGPQLADNLKRLKNVYLDIIHGPNAGPPREKLSFDKSPDAAPPAAPSAAPASVAPGDGTRARNPQTGEVVVLQNGQWVLESGA